MYRQTSITALYAAERHRDLIARAEISRIARATRRRRSVWARLRRGFLASRPDLVPAPPHSDLAPAPPLPDLAPTPPQPEPARTRPLPALSGAAADHAGPGA
jgi:hypothetical protein